jgi:Caspase domain
MPPRFIRIQESPMTPTFLHGYALLVGVGTTAYSPWSLPVTVMDLQAVRKVLTDPALCGYSNDDNHVRLLHDEAATRAAILDGLAWLKAQTAADPEATAVVFYSGHGWLDQTTGIYYLIPHDVKPHNIPGSALPGEDFTAALREVKARRLLAVIDSCHAQGMATSKEAATPVDLPPGLTQAAATEGKGLMEELKQGEGRAVFTSSRGHQVSWVRSDGSLSVFTHHLLEALQGAGNKPGESEVRLSNLMGHLGRAVPNSTRQMHSVDQVPFFDTATEDFPVSLLKGGKGLPAGGWDAEKPEAEMVIRHVRNVVASGERAVAIGGSVSGGTIITGNQYGRGRPGDE